MLDVDFRLSPSELDPGCLAFDPAFYAGFDAHTLSAVACGVKAAVDDFERRGCLLGYSPNAYFDTRYYIRMYSDVQPSIARGQFATAFEHYAQIGHLDRSPHWLFDVTFYLTENPDIPSALIAACGGAYGHYLSFGDREERQGHPLFDPSFYRARNAGRRDAIERRGAFRDYLTHCSEVFPDVSASIYFDPLWYVGRYDSAAHGVRGGTYRCALQHYLTCRSTLELDPLPQFSEREYAQRYSDVLDGVAKKRYTCGYEHFLRSGVDELRSPCVDIDLEFYANIPIVKSTMDGHGPFWHLLSFGNANGLPTAPPLPRDFALSNFDAERIFMTAAQRSLRLLNSRIVFDAVTDPDLDVVVTFRKDVALAAQALASVRSNFQGSIRLSGIDCWTTRTDIKLDDLFENLVVTPCGDSLAHALNDVISRTTAAVVLLMSDDITVHGHAIQVCCSRLAESSDVGAVGAKVLQPNGLIFEAGSVLLRDGGGTRWLHGAPPDAAEANYVREVDFCSVGFLVVRGTLLRNVGGYTTGYADGMFQAADLCLRFKERGFRTMYEPTATITQLEHQSKLEARKAKIDSIASRAALRRRFPSVFVRRPWGGTTSDLANISTKGRRALVITDRFPNNAFDSVPQRTLEIVKCLVSDQWQVTILLTQRGTIRGMRSDLSIPETVEVVDLEDSGSVIGFCAARLSYFDLVWEQLAEVSESLQDVSGPACVGLSDARLVIDFATLPPCSSQIATGLSKSTRWLTLERVASLRQCDHLITFDRGAIANIRAAVPEATVGYVGFCVKSPAAITPYKNRSGLIVVLDAGLRTNLLLERLKSFVEEMLPLIPQGGGDNCALLTIAHDGRSSLPSWLHSKASLRLENLPTSVEVLLSQHLMTVVLGPCSMAGVGVVQRSCACGTPILCSKEISECIGWNGKAFVTIPDNMSPEAMASTILESCKDSVSWEQLQAGALEKMASNHRPELFAKQVKAAVRAAMA